MKTRVKKKHFGTVKDTDLIGIEWGSNTKGLLIETKEGIICLNNDKMDIQNCFATLTKSEYLTKASVKRDQEKVFIFDNKPEMLKWFAKK